MVNLSGGSVLITRVLGLMHWDQGVTERDLGVVTRVERLLNLGCKKCSHPLEVTSADTEGAPPPWAVPNLTPHFINRFNSLP